MEACTIVARVTTGGSDLSDFIDDIDTLASNANGRKECSVSKIMSSVVEDHGKEAHEKLLSLMDNPVYSSNQIYQLLKRHNYKVTRDSVAKHRRMGTDGGCICQP